eukprot:573797-Prymnesium_polylepis.3
METAHRHPGVQIAVCLHRAQVSACTYTLLLVMRSYGSPELERWARAILHLVSIVESLDVLDVTRVEGIDALTIQRCDRGANDDMNLLPAAGEEGAPP